MHRVSNARTTPAFASVGLVLLWSLTVDSAAGPARVAIAGEVELVHRIEATDEHEYLFDLPAGRQWLLTLRERGVDLVLTVEPDSAPSLEFDSPPGRMGVERVFLDEWSAIDLRVTVRPLRSGVPAGTYELRVAAADCADPRRCAAVELDARAKRLMAEAGRAADTPRALLQGEAIRALARAAAIWQELGDEENEALSYYVIGFWEALQSNPEAALRFYGQASDIWTGSGDANALSMVLKDAGATLLALGRYTDAQRRLDEAQQAASRAGNLFIEATAGNDICLSFRFRGEVARAERCYQPIVESLLQQGEMWQAANTIHNLAAAQAKLGKTREALTAYDRAIQIHDELGNNDAIAKTLSARGSLLLDIGHYQAALDDLATARGAFEELGAGYWLGHIESREGEALLSLGEFDASKRALTRALDTQQRVGDSYGIAQTNLLLARLSLHTEQHDAATVSLEESLNVSRRIGSANLEARALLRLGQVAIERGDAAVAAGWLTEARQLAAQHELAGQIAASDMLLGVTLQSDSSHEEALTRLVKARDAFASIGHRLGKLRTELKMIRSLIGVDDTPGALATLKSVPEDLDRLFLLLSSPNLQASFAGSQREFYEDLVDAYLALYEQTDDPLYLGRSFEAAEQGRSRAMLAFIDDARHRVLQSSDPLQAERAELRDRLSREVSRSIRRGGIEDATIDWEQLWRLSQELEGLDNRLRRRATDAKRIFSGAQITEADVRALLDDNTILLEYFLGESSSHLWVISSEGIEHHGLPERAVIDKLARSVLAMLSDENSHRSPNRDPDLARLSDLLLGPVRERTEVGVLVVVADGVLQEVPFSALDINAGSGNSVPVVARYEVARLPSAKTLWAQRQAQPNRSARPRWSSVAIVSDPEYGTSLPRLHAALEEAELIAAHAGSRRIQQHTRFDATRDLFLRGELSDAELIHIAAHGLSNAARPELTGMSLAMVDGSGEAIDGFLGLRDVYDLDLSAGLVVLSGCETAAGRYIRGEMPQGLGVAFLYAGVPRTVTSLWRVSDKAALALMDQFYTSLLEDGLTASAALRAARSALRADREFRHPSHWAAFVLTGDWR